MCYLHREGRYDYLIVLNSMFESGQFFAAHTLLGPILFIIVRALSVIVAPIPGATIDVPGILIFGWKTAFIYAEIGIMLGSLSAFFFTRYFRFRILVRFAFFKKYIQEVERWQERLSKDEQFWALVAIRLATNPFFDIISYAAGLTDITPIRFFFATLLGSMPSMLLFYVASGEALQGGLYYGIGIILVLLILFSILFRHWRPWNKKIK
jgi:uncharacterized membrane protein YdjX (TVP38/TMEM64 family)